jgi:hypothetical protein
MNKYVVGSILAAISLLVIYGASASNRVVSWVDDPGGRPASNGEGTLVGLNSTEDRGQPAQQIVAQVNESDLDPLQKAGQLPQRQTFTDAQQRTQVSVSQNATTPTPTPTATPSAQAQPTTASPQPATTVSNPQPVRALW